MFLLYNYILSDNRKRKERIISTLKKVSTIAANSNFTANIVKQLIEHQSQIKVVYPGANDLRSIESDNFLKIEGDPVLLTLSRLEKRKGHVYILGAIAKLKKELPRII